MTTPYDRLVQEMTNLNTPSGNGGRGWEAGEQLEALRFYMGGNVKILTTHQEPGNEGMVFAVLQNGEDFLLWADDFGDNPGNDALAGVCRHNGDEYIRGTLTLRTRWFDSLHELVEFLHAPDAEAAQWSEDGFASLRESLRSNNATPNNSQRRAPEEGAVLSRAPQV